LLGLTTYPTYKSVTWGQQRDRKRHHYDFYPIYDWSYTDVWKAIHDNGWPYCRIYDYMYQYGIPVHMMRVSNVHHETALDKLFYLQEIEADTWNRITRRIRGISTAGKLGFDDFYVGQDLPFMFADWREYRDYLLEHLITDPAMRKRYVRRFLAMDNMHSAGKYDLRNVDQMYRTQINTILANDFEFTKLRNFEVSVRNRVGR
jgi:predicted phosphoadenosine phosphosulfate sulfurtransferase